MLQWIRIAVAVVAIGLLVVLLTVILRRWCCYRERADFVSGDGVGNLRDRTSLDHHHHQLDANSKRRGNYYVFRRGVSAKPLFNWADHPSLITDAVENGWSRFAFTECCMSPSSTKSKVLLGRMCAVGSDYRRETDQGAEISWEVCPGSADFMQKIRLNSGLKRINVSNSVSMAAASVITAALPLPGPPLGNSSFPQEAYFEITILYSRSNDLDHSVGKGKENGEKTKLIRENSNAKTNSESLVHVEQLKLAAKDGVATAAMVSVGLTGGRSLPLKLPGSYLGSIGFNSTGSVYLDGIKLVYESEKAEWGKTEKVIGCGYDPRQRKVFFTVDSELVHVIHCKSEEFGSPLYPTLAANTDIMVVVNFGQSVFKYGPANAQRTPNPCFIGPLVNSPAAAAALGYDSRELFSMGRIDSQWLNRSTTKGTQCNANANRAGDLDEESDADLFEIVLDSCGRSPNTVLQQQN